MRAVTYFAMAAGLASSMAAAAKITDFTVDPATVELRTRGAWCMGERNTCQILCDGPKENKCDMNTLDYTCTCKNGTEPGLRYYDSSLYSFVCQEAFKQCSEENAGNPVKLLTCEDDIRPKCGTLDVNKFKPAESSDSSDEGDDKGDDSNSDDSQGSDEDSGADADAEGADSEGDKSGSERLAIMGTGASMVAVAALAAFL